jgi:hypothetical protein
MKPLAPFNKLGVTFMKNYFIPRSEILNLYTSALKDISTNTISEWLKSKTNNQFIIVERAFVLDAIMYIERNRYTDGFLGQDLKERWNLGAIKFFV